ncbi:hypothetical protein FVEG_00026 [Fusarium verticillioides 7600]|uniref:Uncharacterized protein n=1 Tax=Gibberella moniliformis (strain M3125 / FGSC 7600) TaxID=334819 RepID=W7LJS8_GIBM7|nr:hypothetical protein FVEG_00026 [Fusarium verticillioides 7600]EWG35820.1 hypothetical protein FVEG_00026 [Fusarium verticillioides 7600]RBQ87625.1 hypothetical protein FVER53263_00026 [Fusarium verticillioides]
MFGNRGPQNVILILAILGSMPGSMVVSLPVTPAKDSKGNVDSADQIVYAVRCHADIYVIAHHCQAHCNGRGHVLFNETRCPVGSDNADDIFSDCYCTPQCVPCKEEGEEQAQEDVSVPE